MPRLLSLRPGAVITGVDLTHTAWRLMFAATLNEGIGWMTLAYAWPPTPSAAMGDTTRIRSRCGQGPRKYLPQVTLLSTPIHFAMGVDGTAALQRAAGAMNAGESLDNAAIRGAEALRLFLNGNRIKEADVTAAGEKLRALVTIGWAVRDWASQGMVERNLWDLDGSRLVALP